MTTHYAVVVDGRVVGTRSSKTMTYTQAVVAQEADGTWNAWTYHGSQLLAAKALADHQSRVAKYPPEWERPRALAIAPVVVTATRAPLGGAL